MSCDNFVGVKNIMATFTNCDTGDVFGPYAHELATEDLPTWKLCPYTNEALSNGYIRRQRSNSQVTINLIRDLRLPLSYYQGCAQIDIQVEYDNGLVYTGKGGSVTGDDMSDSHGVNMTLSYKTLDELLPAGALVAA
jgi:hypothetical protein